MLWLTGYFDAAGHPSGEHALIVGGYLSAVPAWLRFEKEWNAALKKEGLSELHMTDFMACAPPYKVWKGRETDREALLIKLAKITKKHVRYGLSTTLLLDDWREANGGQGFDESNGGPVARSGVSWIAD